MLSRRIASIKSKDQQVLTHLTSPVSHLHHLTAATMVPKPQSWRELRDVLPFHYQQYEDCIPWCEQQFDALEKDPPDPVTRRAERVYMHALIEMYRLELMVCLNFGIHLSCVIATNIVQELANSTSGRSRNEASDLDQRNEQLRASGPGLDGNLAAENMASAGEGERCLVR